MFIRYPGRKSTVPLRVVVPNLFTTVAMCCGLASIHYSLKQDWDRAMFAVLLSAVFDALDGRAARLLKVTSAFGEVLDSLADFLSFGVAPAMLLHQWMLREEGYLGLVAVTTFVLCSAMRLARFTAAPRAQAPPAPGDEQRQVILKSRFFVGLATPAAAAAVMAPVMLAYSKIVGEWCRRELGMALPIQGERLSEMDSPASPGPWVAAGVIAYTLVISFWMISRVPMFSFKKMRVGRRAVVPLLVGAGVVAVLAVRDLWLLMSLLSLAYLGTALLSWPSQRRIVRKPVGEVGESKTRAVRK